MFQEKTKLGTFEFKVFLYFLKISASNFEFHPIVHISIVREMYFHLYVITDYNRGINIVSYHGRTIIVWGQTDRKDKTELTNEIAGIVQFYLFVLHLFI